MLHLCAQYLLWFFVRTLLSTLRFEDQGLENKAQAEKIHPLGSYIFSVWHEQVFSVMGYHAGKKPYLALASRSKDGDYAAFVSKKLGYTSVRGSSSKKGKDKGGKEAMFEYIGKMSKGESGGITVDGPKGPRQVCKPGVVVIARETGAPILPVVAVASRYWEFNSWDRFKIPKPFATIKVKYGEPIVIEQGAGQERVDEVCVQVATSMKKLEQELRGLA